MDSENNKAEQDLESIVIDTPFIKLDSFLKFCGAAVTGAEAKELVLSGQIKVNDEICITRGKKLYNNDIAEVCEKRYKVVSRADS